MSIYLSLIIGICLLLVQVIKFRFSPFISLLTSSIVIGLLSGLDGEIIINNIQQGMGSTLGYIAVIVGLGAMFGAILESTGGAKEITAVKYELSEDVFGVISNTAAYLMNAGAGSDETHPPVAVSGRVEVKVVGKVSKGDRLVSAGEGLARAAKVGEATSFNTIGRALTDKTDDGVGYVESFVAIK